MNYFQDTAEIFKVLQKERDHFKDVCLRLESKIEVNIFLFSVPLRVSGIFDLSTNHFGFLRVLMSECCLHFIFKFKFLKTFRVIKLRRFYVFFGKMNTFQDMFFCFLCVYFFTNPTKNVSHEYRNRSCQLLQPIKFEVIKVIKVKIFYSQF